LLQPLVENAVKHGIAGLVEGGAIRLVARRGGGNISLVVENAFDPEGNGARGTGMGQAHVRRRPEGRDGEQAAVEAAPGGSVYRVVLRLPCESPMASSSRA